MLKLVKNALKLFVWSGSQRALLTLTDACALSAALTHVRNYTYYFWTVENIHPSIVYTCIPVHRRATQQHTGDNYTLIPKGTFREANNTSCFLDCWEQVNCKQKGPGQDLNPGFLWWKNCLFPPASGHKARTPAAKRLLCFWLSPNLGRQPTYLAPEILLCSKRSVSYIA